MIKQVIAPILACAVLSGCVTGWTGPTPMSRHWASEQRHQMELKQRRERIGPPLFGGKVRRKDGEKPRTLIGSEDGLGAELQNAKGGMVKYGLRW